MKKLLVILFILSLIYGCASTSVLMHQVGDNSICDGKTSSLILWGPAWRKDQKEPKLREEIAEKAINKFLSDSNCFSNYKILRTANNKSAIELSDIEAINLSKESGSKYDKIIFIRLEELGPVVHLNLSPILLDGSTNVEFRVRILDTKTSFLEYDNEMEWNNGGPYVLKGISTLQQDMYDALKLIFHKINV